MNYTIDVHNIKRTHAYSINVSQCGIMTCFGKCISIPRFYDNYVLTFVVKGEGTYTINGKVHAVKAGQAMLTSPNIITSWTTNAENPWQYIFITLNGIECRNFLTEAGLGDTSRIFDFSLDDEIVKNLYNLYENSKNTDQHYMCMAYFYFIMGCLATKHLNTSKITCQKNDYLENAMIYIDNNYCHNITVNDIAQHLNIERSYLYKIFSQELGVSPIHFLTEYRLSKAIEMLENHPMPVSTIATAVGFYDFSHFSRLFQKKYGMTPGKYRKSIRHQGIPQAYPY